MNPFYIFAHCVQVCLIGRKYGCGTFSSRMGETILDEKVIQAGERSHHDVALL